MGENDFSIKSKRGLNVTSFITDILLITLAFHLAFVIRFHSFVFNATPEILNVPSSVYPLFEGLVTFGWIIFVLVVKVYSYPVHSHKQSTISNAVRAALILLGVSLLTIVVQGGQIYPSRLFLLYFFVISTVFLLLHHLLHASKYFGVRQTKNILIIGANPIGYKLADTINSNESLGYHVVGFLENSTTPQNHSAKVLGSLADVRRVLESTPIDEVIITDSQTNEAELLELVNICENQFIRVNIIGSGVSYLEGKHIIEHIGGIPIIRMRDTPLDDPTNKSLKRTFDVIFSVCILIFIFPPIAIICSILIKMTSRGPVFFKQLRTGEDGKEFVCYKFRTMHTQEPDLANVTESTARLTSIGRFLRKTNLDELPQFWNALKGDMSVVGPRPHMLRHTEDYKIIINNYMLRHFVKPGVTGWAQVNGLRGATDTPDKMDKRVTYDIYYIDNWTFTFDLYIIWRTIITMLRGDKNAY